MKDLDIIILLIILGILMLSTRMPNEQNKTCIERDFNAKIVPFKFNDGNRMDYEKDYPCKKWK